MLRAHTAPSIVFHTMMIMIITMICTLLMHQLVDWNANLKAFLDYSASHLLLSEEMSVEQQRRKVSGTKFFDAGMKLDIIYAL